MLFSSKYVIWKDFCVPPCLLLSLFSSLQYTQKKCQHELPAETSFLFLNLSTCLLTAGAAASEKNKCAYNAFVSYIVMMIRPCDFKLLSSKTLIKEMNLSYIFFCKFLQIFCSRRRLKCKCWSQLKGVDFTHGKMISKDMREEFWTGNWITWNATRSVNANAAKSLGSFSIEFFRRSNWSENL